MAAFDPTDNALMLVKRLRTSSIGAANECEGAETEGREQGQRCDCWRPSMVQGRHHIRAARQVVLRQEWRRNRRLPGAGVEARLLAGPGRHGALALAILSV